MVDLIYTTGTVSVGPGDTTIVGDDTVWSNLRDFDWIAVDGGAAIPIEAVVDVEHVTIAPWQSTAKTGVSYKAYMISPLRYEGGEQAADVARLVRALNKDGFFVFVDDDETEPSSPANEGQYALQPTTGKMWFMSGGAWNFMGIFRGFGLPRPWDNVTTFQPFDVATRNGTSYVAIQSNTNQMPPNATYWAVLAAKGDTGSTGPVGPGYGGTSSTSLTIGTGSRVFTTQTGMAYQLGTRMRAASAANPSNYMEGIVTAYSGTFLTANISRISGAGTLADWMLSVAGDPGSGDMLSTSNLSDLANKPAALTNLGGTAIGKNIFTATDDASVRALLSLGSAALLASSAVARTANNLSDLASASTALTNLGVSTFIKTLLDDTDGATAWTTLGAATNNATNGYFKLPSGLIVQYGTLAQGSGVSDSTLNFPITFPNSCRAVIIVPVYNNVGGSEIALCNVSNIGTGSCSVRSRYILGTAGPTASSGMTHNWIAIGY